LCGLILSYLSSSDCFRFECLSKQWRRLVYKSAHSLVIYGKEPNSCLKKDDSKPRAMNWKTLQVMVKKLPIITSIYIEINAKTTEKVLEQLLIECHNLAAIHVTFGDTIDGQIADQILDKYGHQLTAVSLPKSNDVIKAFNSHSESYTRLQEIIHCNTVPLKLSVLFNDHNQLLVKDLTRFTFDYTGDQDLPLLQTFVDHYSHRLKSIQVHRYLTDKMEVLDVLTQLSKLEVLNELKIYVNFKKISITKTFTDCLKQLSTKCRRLKSFRFYMYDIRDTEMTQILPSISGFKRLRELQLMFSKPNTESHENCLDFSLKSLSPLKRMTHLWLTFGGFALNETLFDSIDTHLPRLQTLKFTSSLEISAGIEESVHKLPKLRRFELQTK